jgi:uncharacterized membrane protein
LNTLTTRRSRPVFQKIKDYTQIANFVASVGLIILISLGSYEAFRVEVNTLLVILSFFEVLKFISLKHQTRKEFPNRIFERRARGQFLAVIALGYAAILPFNLEYSQFWRFLLTSLVFANFMEFNNPKYETIVYYSNIVVISLILCAGIWMGPAETLFPGFFCWFLLGASFVLLERLLFSKMLPSVPSKVS